MSTNTKLAEPVNAVAVLRNVLNTLKHENSKPDGSISDTIWYSAYETLFDYVESSLEAIAAHDAEQAQEPISYLVRARWPDRIEEYLEVRGVTVLGVGKVGIDVDIPKLHPFGAAPVEQAQPMFPKCASGTSEQAAQAVPAGFKWVPVEPTPEMKTAGLNVEVYQDSPPEPESLTWAEVRAIYRAMLSAAPRPEAVAGWQPIETAPKDGSLFLCWVEAVQYGENDEGQQYQIDVSQVDFCQWQSHDDAPDGGWFEPCCGQISYHQRVTHWMPLPAAPQEPTHG